MNIGYYSEPVAAYNKAIDGAKNKQALLDALMPYALVAQDALEAVRGIKSWKDFKRGLYLERHGRFAGEAWAEKYAAILMPLVMFEVSLVAEKFTAPWGTAYIRLKDIGMIVEHDGVAVWRKPTPARKKEPK